jgi:hypothetical protein
MRSPRHCVHSPLRSCGMSMIFCASASAGSPIQIQIQPQRSATGKLRTAAVGGICSCPGMCTHLPLQSKVMPW